MNRKATGIAAILLCFTVGVVVGFNANSLWLKYKFHNSDKPIPYILGDGKAEFMLRRLSKDLNLTPEQNKKLQKISQTAKNEFEEFFNENRPKMDNLVKKFELEIQEILTDEQKVQYVDFQKRQRKLMRMPQPHNLPSPDEIKKHKKDGTRILNKFFDDFDTDKNGLISLTEAPSFLENRFELIDENNDQNISREEMANSVERHMQPNLNEQPWGIPQPGNFDRDPDHTPGKNGNPPPRPHEFGE